MSRTRDRALSPAELHAFGDELDALRRRVEASLGAREARYIRRIVAAVLLYSIFLCPALDTGKYLLVGRGYP